MAQQDFNSRRVIEKQINILQTFLELIGIELQTRQHSGHLFKVLGEGNHLITFKHSDYERIMLKWLKSLCRSDSIYLGIIISMTLITMQLKNCTI